MPLINCKINLILTWFKNCVISPNTNANQSTTTITDTILISTNHNAKLLQQLK